MREDHFAAWAWLTLAVIINVFWISVDLYAHATGHKLMTTQMRDWLASATIGPFIMGYGLIGSFTAILYHFLRRGR